MKNSILVMALLSATVFTYPDITIASGIPTHTHTNTLGLKPAFSFAETDHSFKIASVCFLGNGDCGSVSFGKGDDYNVDTAKQCLNEGFILNNCNSAQSPENYCPYNKAYISKCKCNSNLISCPAGQVGVGDNCNGKYASCQCSPSLLSCPNNKNGSGANCGGKYQACVCKPEYLYTSSNCLSPRSVSGANCDGKYTGCVCPTGVTNLPYGCETYYPSPCSSICKKAYSDNCRNRTAVSTPYGCMNYFSDCSTKCERAYPDNCRNRTDTSCAYGCASYYSDCTAKCAVCKTCDDSCPTGYSKTNPGGCYNTSTNQCGNTCYKSKTCCTPYPDETGCTIGTTMSSNGCGGLRRVCVCEGASTSPCGEYTVCSTCTYNGTTYYKVQGCETGFRPSGNSCYCPAGKRITEYNDCVTCLNYGYSYCPGDGNKYDCSDGTYSVGDGASSCYTCPAGYYCRYGKSACPAGKTSPAGSSSYSDCV